MMNNNKKNIVVLASGSGTNAENIINFSKLDNSAFNVVSVMCNKADAYVLTRAANHNIPSIVFSSKELKENRLKLNGQESTFTEYLKEHNIEYIILAGFLLKIPPYLIEMYKGRILNIHPALLPNYGGKGMYGEHVHQAVIAAKEKKSGITIHIADEHYDHGQTVHQSECEITPEDTPETLAQKIHELERIYPTVINNFIKSI
jgi:phosphoribosylglycinamide formyltransferase-1